MFGDADPMDRSVRTYSEQLHGAILHSAGLQGSPVANDTHNRCPIVAKALYTWNRAQLARPGMAGNGFGRFVTAQRWRGR